MPRPSTIWARPFTARESWTRPKPAFAARWRSGPTIAAAHDNLGTVLWEQGKLEEAEASTRRALALAPGFTRALDNLGAMLTDQGRLNEAIAVYRRLLQMAPRDSDGLNGLARVLAAQGDAASALETVHQSLRIGETADAKRIFVDIAKQARLDERQSPSPPRPNPTHDGARLDRGLGPAGRTCPRRGPTDQAECAHRRLRGAGRAGLATALIGAGIVRSGRPGRIGGR